MSTERAGPPNDLAHQQAVLRQRYADERRRARKVDGKTPMKFLGKQWKVTPRGLEARDRNFVIARDQLWVHEAVTGWVLQLAAIGRVDLPEFVEALRIARSRFASEPKNQCGRAAFEAQHDDTFD